MELVLFIGLPASGKTSFYQQRFASTHLHVSKDLMPNQKRRDRRQAQMIEQAFERGGSVVLDNTHPARVDRRAWLELAHRWKAEPVGYYFASSLAECQARNQARERQVPEVAFFSILKKLERPAPEEGFARLYYVRLTATGFQVEDYNHAL
ncbi:MAG: AAA family ATPase [Candidatus Eremiobacteraeota bacterium]|nr:AAA family ATPase [Candidatus Eremiobacteraeota bacterium]